MVDLPAPIASTAPEARALLSPPLKWAGGKRWLVPHLRPLWQSSRGRLVEPLCGGRAVALNLLPERALLNDINPHNINFYRWLQRGLVVGIEMENNSGLYYRHRGRFNQLIAEGGLESSEAAQLFYYLNRTGYNGLCRFNRRSQFNVPFGRHASINYKREFLDYRDLLAGWDFQSADFERLDLTPGDFVYADPPYDVQFREYSRGSFAWEDQVRLVDWLLRHDGPVAISNQATDRVLELYRERGLSIEILKGPRMISRTGDRTKAKEVLAIKNI